MKMALALALAVAVTAPAFARTAHNNPRRGLHAYAYTTQAPANPNPSRPVSRSAKEDGSGAGVTAPSAANPVTKAPLDWSAGKLVTKMWAAASSPPAFPVNTFAAELQVPLVFVSTKLISSDE